MSDSVARPDDTKPQELLLEPEDLLAARAIDVLMAVPPRALAEMLAGDGPRTPYKIPRIYLVALAKALEDARPGLLELAQSRERMQERS